MREIPEESSDCLSVRRDVDSLAPRVVTTCPSLAPHLHVSHGGIVTSEEFDAKPWIDASASINPLGPPDWLRQEIELRISALNQYPDRESMKLRRVIAEAANTTHEQVVVGNGSSELLAWLPQVVESKHFLVPVPSYGEYRRSAALAGCDISLLPLGAPPDFALDWHLLETLLDRPSVVVLGHPNNPTGKLLDVDQFEQVRRRHPETLFVVDEAFADFCSGFSSVWQPDAHNLLVLRSLTKSLTIAGLRLGYALGSPALVQALATRLPPWSINLLAQRVGERFFEDRHFLPAMRKALLPLKMRLLEGLRQLPACRVFDTVANWVLVELAEPGLRAREVVAACRAHGLALRALDDFPNLSGQWLRVSLRNREQTEQLLETLGHVLGSAAPRSRPKRTRAIMLQGTSSDAGKSLLVTALCRCLAQDGYRVAPFKAQNMSNNSGIARDGGELGRAQVVQAQACGILPDTRMNPVLLKPTSDRGAQVVLRGEVLGHRDVLGYLATKQRCLKTALDAYDELCSDFDVVVCEGAGSAGEMNLRRADIVNMGFVEQRNMPVLLVGDIDRGGVYASFVGHLEVMTETDRANVHGFLVNRFRGDPSLLADAHQWVQKHTGRPVLGVIPFLKELSLPDEDRLSLESGRRRFGLPEAPIHIAVVAPPHVSNATDIDPLTFEEDVYLYLVERPEEMGAPDVVLMLGTKNTMGDMAHFRRLGMDHAIRAAHARGAEIIGICGGLQMLGQRIEDADAVEGLEKSVEGLGLLPLCTRFLGPKKLRHCSGKHVPSGATVHGYEIHHGATDFSDVPPLFVDDDGSVLGGGLPESRVWGTYIHGLFESDSYRREFLDTLRERKALPRLGTSRKLYSLEPSFDRLAAVFRESVDYPAILRLMGLG